MFFANPIGLLGLLSLPVIIGIHMFQRRFPQVDVAGLHLWGLELKVKKSGRRMDRLPISRTLLLELLCGLMLTLLLAQPRISTTSQVNRWLIVLDNSASMSSVANSGESFKARVIRAIEERTGKDAAVTILLTGNRPTTLAGPRVSWSEAKSLVESWEPSERLHGFQSAWDMASELATPRDRLLFVTDHRVEDNIDLPSRMSVVAVGEALDNLCFETARWTRGASPQPDQLFLRVSNRSDQPQQATLIANSGDAEIFQQTIDLPANSASAFQQTLPAALKRLDLELRGERDGLLADSQVTLLQPKLRTIRYSMKLNDSEDTPHPARRSLERILDLLDHTQLVDADPDIVFGKINEPVVGANTLTWLGIGPYQLNADSPDGESTAGDSGPAATPGGDTVMDEPGDGDGDGVAASGAAGDDQADDASDDATGSGSAEQDPQQAIVPRSSKGPFLIDRREPMLEGITLDGVFWSGIVPVNFRALPLVSTGSLMLLGRSSDSRLDRLYLNCDLGRSNLLSSQDWPILISNLVELSRERLPGLRAWNYKIGESIRFRMDPEQFASSESRSLTLKYVRRDGLAREKTVARLPEIDIPPLSESGVYEIFDGAKIDSFAVNFFDADESDLRHLNSGEIQGQTTPAHSPQARETNLTWLWWLLLTVAALAMVLDWFVLRPKKVD